LEDQTEVSAQSQKDYANLKQMLALQKVKYKTKGWRKRSADEVNWVSLESAAIGQKQISQFIALLVGQK
jgi:hypothetical protein